MNKGEAQIFRFFFPIPLPLRISMQFHPSRCFRHSEAQRPRDPKRRHVIGGVSKPWSHVREEAPPYDTQGVTAVISDLLGDDSSA